MSGDYQLEDTVYIPFSTRAFATGIPTALVSGEVQIYEDASITQITAAETLSVSLDGIAGFNMVAVAATAANGFGTGQSYTLILSAGTVDSVSVIGEVVGHFTIEASAAALDLANGTDGLGAIKAETASILTDTGTTIPGTITTMQGNVTDIVADTNELQGDWTDGGRLDALLDAVLLDTGTTIPGTITTMQGNVTDIVADTNELQGDWADGGRLDLLLDAVKAKTDGLTFTYNSTTVDANIQSVNETAIDGTGGAGDTWGPV